MIKYIKDIPRALKHLWHRTHHAFTGEFYPYNQCEGTANRGGRRYVCCSRFKHHSGDHAFPDDKK